jgi:type II secretory pathway pseudopilin PulG
MRNTEYKRTTTGNSCVETVSARESGFNRVLCGFSPAFTLAEILIAAGIIGIIAVILLAAIFNNIQQQQYTIAQELFMDKLVQATRQMRFRSGLSGYSTTEAFVAELGNFMKINKVCEDDLSDCFATEISNAEGTRQIAVNTLKTAQNFGRKDYDTNIIGLMFANGNTAIIAYDPACVMQEAYDDTTDTTACISMVYDINSLAQPNRASRDIYTLNATLPFCDGITVGALCVAGTDTTFAPINTCSGDSEWDSLYTSTSVADATGSTFTAQCANNRWAGAKKACAAMGMRMPSFEELTQIHGYNWANNSPALNMSGSYWASGWAAGYTDAQNAWQRNLGAANSYTTTIKYNAAVKVRCVK